mgnify:CR=1 FL=1
MEQAVDEKSNGVDNPEYFAKYVFAEIEKRGKMNLNQLMKELDLVIDEYEKGVEVE